VTWRGARDLAFAVAVVALVGAILAPEDRWFYQALEWVWSLSLLASLAIWIVGARQEKRWQQHR
jgi:hypothetical protein